ncbi:MAG: hypothetical protein JJ879_00250 [Sneathiella sp.]|nr:hypothetical protein [Sneathiella sp.]
MMPSTHLTEISFDSKGEPLKLELSLISQLPSTFEITSHDRHGVYQGTIMKGNNLNGPNDSFHIPTSVDELDQRIIGWNIIFSSPDELDEAEYEAILNFIQGTDEPLSPPLVKSGAHQNEKIVMGFARFVARPDTFLNKTSTHPNLHTE